MSPYIVGQVYRDGSELLSLQRLKLDGRTNISAKYIITLTVKDRNTHKHKPTNKLAHWQVKAGSEMKKEILSMLKDIEALLRK